MDNEHPGYRIFFLGAGFSVPAGLPVASELFKEVKKKIENNYGVDTKFHQSLCEYIDYRKRCDGVCLTEDDVDLEEFMSYLDIEHFLGLEGSDTLSDHGNAAQMFIKRYIGQVIHEKTPAADKLPNEYYEFAENLAITDTVITLNYDVILERALDHIGKPYRLFPQRYKTVHESFNTVDNSKEEVRILKLHGSLDWVSNKSYLHSVAAYRKQGFSENPHNLIFNNRDRYGHYPLVDGPRSVGDPLLNIFRLGNVDEFYQQASPPTIPMILSPSHMKIVYASSFMDFWYGMGQAGGMSLGVSIIGFSLPEHDDYVRVSLFKMVTNYQEFSWDVSLLDYLKDDVKLVDFRQTADGKEELVNRYQFIDKEKAEIYTDGFSSDAVEFLFHNKRMD